MSLKFECETWARKIFNSYEKNYKMCEQKLQLNLENKFQNWKFGVKIFAIKFGTTLHLQDAFLFEKI